MREGHKTDIRQRFLNEKEAAAFLGCSVQFLQKQRSRGSGPTYYRQPRLIRYDIEDLELWMRKHRVEPEPKPINLLEKRGRPRKYPLIIDGKIVKPAAARQEVGL